MSICSKTKGFTLLEMLVTIAIIVVLAGIFIPVLTNSMEKTKEAVAIANCREAVLAGDILALDEMSVGTLVDSDDLDSTEDKNKIIELTNIGGVIGKIVVDLGTAEVVYLEYIESNSLTAIYEKQRTPSYYIANSISSNAPGYNYAAAALLATNNLLEEITDRNKQTQALQQLFLEENAGVYPALSSDEKEILTSKGLLVESADSMNWRPMLSSGGDLFLVASNASLTTPNPIGCMIYYDGHYYYWCHYGKVKTTYVSDQNFNISVLDSTLTSPPSSTGVWLCSD